VRDKKARGDVASSKAESKLMKLIPILRHNNTINALID